VIICFFHHSYGIASNYHGRKKPLKLDGVTQHLRRTNDGNFCSGTERLVIVVVVETFFFLVDGGDYFFVDAIFFVGNGFVVV
jgi:hypothetical protein